MTSYPTFQRQCGFTLNERRVRSSSGNAAHALMRERFSGSRCSRLRRLRHLLFARREISGDHSGGETPVPIPNTAVKPTSADGTALATGWKSRSLPGISLFCLHTETAGACAPAVSRLRDGFNELLNAVAPHSCPLQWIHRARQRSAIAPHACPQQWISGVRQHCGRTIDPMACPV